MSEVPEAARSRPGVLRRAAAGAWHVPAGFFFLLKRPRLLALAALPIALVSALLVAGLVAGLFAVPVVDELVVQQQRSQDLLARLFTAALFLGLPFAGMLAGFALALVLTAPILEKLSERVEAIVRGVPQPAGRGLAADVRDALRGAFYFASRAPGVFLISLVPIVGAPLGALWAAHALAFQLTEGPLVRQGLDFMRRRLWHARFRAESLGFGLLGFATLFVPLANLLVAPALVVGATRLVLELRETEARG